MKILLVEDQHDIAANIWDFLERRGHVVDHAADGATGLMHALRGRFDAIVLDLGLPRLDGLDLCRQLRAAGHGVPVLMLTARDTLEDKLRGFSDGADDYMVKPFELKELEARLRVLHRRTQVLPGSQLCIGPLTYEPDAMLARREGMTVTLTRTHARILEYLMQRSPAVISHQSLIEHLWGEEGRDVATLHNHVYALRQLIDRPFLTMMIQSVHGIGYRLRTP